MVFKSPLPFALVLLSIEWARCLGEMIMARRASSWQNPCPAAPTTTPGTFNVTLWLGKWLYFDLLIR
jgi:hypothetical protein